MSEIAEGAEEINDIGKQSEISSKEISSKKDIMTEDLEENLESKNAPEKEQVSSIPEEVKADQQVEEILESKDVPEKEQVSSIPEELETEEMLEDKDLSKKEQVSSIPEEM